MPHVPALVEALRAASTTSPDKPAVILPDRIFSFADLDRLSSTVAANLLDAGLRRAERIALHLTNGIEIVIAYYACFRIGAIALPINTRFKTDEIDYVLRHAEAAAYIGQSSRGRSPIGRRRSGAGTWSAPRSTARSGSMIC